MKNEGVNFVGWFLMATFVVTALGFSAGNFIEDRKRVERDHVDAILRYKASFSRAGASPSPDGEH